MNDNRLTIRRAVESDGEDAYKLMIALGYPSLDRAQFETTFAAVLAHSEMVVLIAEDQEGRVVGLISMSHKPQLRLGGRVVTIDELVAADDMRGQGIGRALLESAKEFAKQVKARRLELETNRARESYRRGFYVKNGFVEANSAVMRLTADSMS